MPAVSTVITGAGGATNKTVTANGIPLGAWETLYYILPLGGVSTSLPANFRVVKNSSNIDIPSTWIKICTYNSEAGYVDFACGISLRPNSSINSNLYDILGTDVSGPVASANKLETTRAITIGSTSKNFDGSAPVSWSLAEIGAQALDADLTVIASLSGTVGLLKKNCC